MKSSNLSFHKLSSYEKVNAICDLCRLEDSQREIVRDMIERRNGYSGFAHNFKINQKDYFVYLETEEASVVQGASYGAKLCYESGGFRSSVLRSNAIGQIQFIDVKEPDKAADIILEKKNQLLEIANESHKYSKATGLGVKSYGCELGNFLDVKLYVDPGESMGAALAGEMADSIRGEIADLIGAKSSRGMPSNYCGRLVETELKVPIDKLARKDNKSGEYWSGRDVNERILWLDEYAKHDLDRALTSNKGIMNGVIGVAQATSQDTRAIEAANTTYQPLSTWMSDCNYLYGRSKILIPCGIVGGEVKNYRNADFLLKNILRVESSDELAEIMASVGLANNLAALSMHSTKGLKRCHGMHRL
jgi:hydroxymethylglutaryl-CoA reductase